MIYCLTSCHDTSRDFPNQVPEGLEVTFLDVYQDDLSGYFGPPFRAFPSVCCSLISSGVVSTTLVGMIEPQSWDEVIAVTTAFDNQDMLSSICMWGAHQAGQVVAGPLVSQFETAILKGTGLSTTAALQIPLTFHLLESNTSGWVTYWTNTFSPTLDAESVATVNSLIAQYGIQ